MDGTEWSQRLKLEEEGLAQRRGEEELDVNGYGLLGGREIGRGRGRGVRGYLLEVIGRRGGEHRTLNIEGKRNVGF